MSTAPEVSNIISLIKDLDINTGFNIVIPSLNKEVCFKQLTTEQLKRLLKTVIDTPIYNTEFILTFNSIIKENCLDNTIDTCNLTIYDKLLLLFKTRIESISETFTFSITDEEKQQYEINENSKTINLLEHFNKFMEKNISFRDETFTVNNCTVICSLPTIETENKLEKELHKNTKLEVTTPEELRAIVGDTFINELTKFISRITIQENTIDLLNLPFKTRISIVEKLPTNIINNVIKYIENYRNAVKSLLTVKVLVDTKEVEKDIPQDASFFNM